MALTRSLALFVLLTGCVFSPAVTAQGQFEVASVKPNTSGSRASSCCGGPGRFTAQNVTLGMLIYTGYRVQDFQVFGGPNWLNVDRYDIQATAPENASQQGVLQGPMLQRLLEDRFKLAVHRETKELPVWRLTVAKGGSKLKSAECTPRDPNATPPSQSRSGVCGASMMDNNMLRATQIDMPRFIAMLTFLVRRPVIDATGFTGTFDVNLTWNPNEVTAQNAAGVSPADTGASIFTALAEELGLRLESGRGPVEVLLIDRAEKPTDN